MEQTIIIASVTLVVAGLTFFSGFGLGTLLMPAFALFVPVNAAVAATAIVHLANNLFKFALIGTKADRGIVLRFAVPAALTAITGALLLNVVSDFEPLVIYRFAGRLCMVTPVKLLIACLMILFALVELIPGFTKITFDRRFIPLGGMLSGFFGGLSGHQGALRTAFLMRAGLDRDAYLGTIVTSAIVVDISRLVIYGATYFTAHFTVLRNQGAIGLIGVGTVAAFIGSFIASRFLTKITLGMVKRLVGVLLVILAATLGAGIV